MTGGRRTRALTAARVAAALGMAALAASPLASAAGEWKSWCGDAHASLGWHFYCDRAEEPVDARAREASPEPSARQSAKERVLAVRRALEEARARAVLEPSTANVRAYLALQRDTLARAAAFSDVFRRTVWSTPELDYTLTRPVGALAKQVWSDERRRLRDAALAGLGKRYGLIYIADGACAACRVAGPLLRAFSVRHGLDVLAVSMSGEALEGWPEAVADNGRAARLGLARAPLPAVVLFDTETRAVLPVGFGVLAEDQLAERLFVLTALEAGRDY